MSTIFDYASHVKSALNLTDEDLQACARDGSVKLFSGPPASGYTPILTVPEGVVAASAYARYRYNAYNDELSLVRAERAAGRENFFHVVHKMRSPNAASRTKAAQLGLSKVYGRDVIMHPYLGMALRLQTDLCLPFHHLVLQHLLGGFLGPDLDAVFEIGAGVGDAVAELAARNPWSHIEFYGGEIARNGLACLAEFSSMLGLRNLHGVDFNIMAPDFSFLTGKKKVLVFSQFALVYINPFPPQFFLDLLGAADEITVVMLEPFSFSLTEQFGHKPIFARARAQSYGICEEFWPVIQSLEAQGKIVIDEVIPDFAGKGLLSAVSLVTFRKRK